MNTTPTWFATIQAIGIVSFGVNTMILARQHDFSITGVMMVTLAASIAGPTARDLILGPEAQPLAWVVEPGLLVVILAIAAVYMSFPKIRAVVEDRHFLIKEGAEGVAFASLAMFGADRAVKLLADTMQPSWRGQLALPIVTTLVALIGSTGGSVLRDLMLGDKPEAFLRANRFLPT
jgi:uncharacterized membrane protein YeiH